MQDSEAQSERHVGGRRVKVGEGLGKSGGVRPQFRDFGGVRIQSNRYVKTRGE